MSCHNHGQAAASPTPLAHSPLLAIPVEVLLLITSHLTTRDYGSLRLTCRHIEASLFGPFSNEFFSKRRFFMAEPSLQALIDMSKHPRLSHRITHVYIGLENHYNIKVSGGLLNITEDQRLREHQAACDHISLMRTGQGLDMLTEAFRNLSNLSWVGIRGYSRLLHQPRDNVWKRGYGWEAYNREVPHRTYFRRLTEVNDWVSHVFAVVLQALARAESAANNLDVVRGCGGLADQAFNLPPYLAPVLRPVLSNLKLLHLDLDGSDWRSRIPIRLSETQLMPDDNDYDWPLLKRFLGFTPALAHLRLNLGYVACTQEPRQGPTQQPVNSRGQGLISWLANSNRRINSLHEKPEGASLSVKFDHLTRLDIGRVTIQSRVLIKLMKRFRTTLRTVSFHRVCLVEKVHNKHCRPNEWFKFLSRLARLGTNITALNLSFLWQKLHGDDRIIPVFFDLSRVSSQRTWSGDDLASGIDEVLEGLHLFRKDKHEHKPIYDDSEATCCEECRANLTVMSSGESGEDE